jgi:hypothetical protein
MLRLAEKLGEELELLALWDGADVGKPGGTGSFVNEVQRRGGSLSHLDITRLWGMTEQLETGRLSCRG